VSVLELIFFILSEGMLSSAFLFGAIESIVLTYFIQHSILVIFIPSNPTLGGSFQFENKTMADIPSFNIYYLLLQLFLYNPI